MINMIQGNKEKYNNYNNYKKSQDQHIMERIVNHFRKIVRKFLHYHNKISLKNLKAFPSQRFRTKKF